MMNFLLRFKPKKEDKDVAFVIFAGFWLTYAFARVLIYLFPTLFTSIHGVHIHHFSYGIIILSLVGFYSLALNTEGKKLYKTAFLFGIGLALTYDEFGMWLRLTDDGVARFGYDAVALISIGFVNLLYLEHHWRALNRNLKNFLPKVRKFLFN